MTDKSIGKLREMAKRGRNYRDDFETEMFGETVKYELRPMVDKEFLPLSAKMAELLGIEEESIRGGETVDEALEEIDEARDEEETIDVGALDEEFVELIQKAAWLSLTAMYDEDGERVEFENDEDARDVVEDLVGGYSLEIGYDALDLSGNIRDADKFRGSRGSL